MPTFKRHQSDVDAQFVYQQACLAGEQAAMNCVVFPMFVQGHGFFANGACGGAQVIIDGRTALARWLLKTGHARRHYKGGIVIHISHGTQSVDRCRAYAEAFAKNLRLYGIHPVVVRSYLS